MKINEKWLIIQSVKKIIVHHPAYFWPFLKAQAEKTDATLNKGDSPTTSAF